MRTRNAARSIVKHPNSLILPVVLIIMAAIVAVPFYSASSSSLGTSKSATSAPVELIAPADVNASANRNLSWVSNRFALPMLAPPPGESIATYDSTCTNPKTSFDLGETVCAHVVGVPLGTAGRPAAKIGWVSPYGSLTQGGPITTDPQDSFYTIPSNATETYTGEGGGTVTIDNRGTWRVGVYRTSDASRREYAEFTVHDPAKAFVDLSVSQSQTDSRVSPGSSSVFELFVNNYGPDAAQSVVLRDTVPDNTTDTSITDHGSGFSCGAIDSGVITCTLASFPAGSTAHLTFNYSVSVGASAGTVLTNVVDVSSSATPCAPDSTCEVQPDDNSSTATVTVASGSGSATCTLDCPDNVNAVANTTEGGQRGAHVTFDAAETSGTCGAVTASPASGSFFAVGATTVSVSSETGGGSCTFVVTVEDNGTNPPSISCPANQTANADSSCSATVNVGTATATGDNVTIFATRSDGKPMYTCDVNGTNCVRRSSDDPFTAGVTTITWVARSHNAPGPYADEDAEISHRTGASSCTQTITVNDVTPPTITAPNTSASADANCMAPVPDYSTLATVSDNCACASSDTSQTCDTRQDITITQSPAAGTMVGLGPHTITLTANDGSSNNNGAGNSTTINVTFTVNDTTPPVITCPGPVSANSEPGTCAAHVTPGTATATDNCDSSVTITGTRGDGRPLTDTYPVGTTTITWTATDDSGNHSSCEQTVTVVDTEPPVITVTGQTTSMWPPNHKYNTFQVTNFVTGASDNCGGSIPVGNVIIETVTSDEIENGNGDGNTTNDIVIASNCRSVQLRSEREGDGNGRVYTITFRVTDSHGNVGRATSKVVVPHNPGQTAVDSGVHYTVNSSNCP